MTWRTGDRLIALRLLQEWTVGLRLPHSESNDREPWMQREQLSCERTMMVNVYGKMITTDTPALFVQDTRVPAQRG